MVFNATTYDLEGIADVQIFAVGTSLSDKADEPAEVLFIFSFFDLLRRADPKIDKLFSASLYFPYLRITAYTKHDLFPLSFVD